MEVDGKSLERLRIKKGLSIPQLAEAADVSTDTIERIEKYDGRRRPNILKKISNVLGANQVELLKNFPETGTTCARYDWEDLVEGARAVAEEIYFSNSNTLAFDAALTFPGPSSIFCGLVLARLPLKVFIRMPVYTAIFLDRTTHLASQNKRCFVPVELESFTILVPRELVDRTKKVIVIDDTILTGGVMEKLREHFHNFQFACCICDDAYKLPNRKRPEFVGLDFEARHRFPMPWGRDSFCFEDPFKTGG
jgi:transcriptional regulator with XRE-family HTH domain